MNDRDIQFGIASPREIPTWSLALPFIPLGLWLVLHFALPEPALFYALNHSGKVAPDAFWGFFVFLGNGWGVFALCFPLLLFAPRLIIAGAVGGAIAGLLSKTLKPLIAEPRPLGVLDPDTFIIIGRQLKSFSMPSGHTLTAFAIAAGIYFAIPAARRQPFWWLFVLAALAGLSRVTVGAHWPADVFAGAAIGLFSGIMGAYVTTKLPRRLYEPQSWLMRQVAVMGLVAIYTLFTDRLDFELNRPYQIVGLVAIFITLTHFVPISLRGQGEHALHQPK